jgi:peptidoglycan hydrolase CwlO-like protein
LTVEVGVLVSVLMLIIAYLGYQLNKQKETKADSRQDAKLQTQLEYISKGVDDIRIDLKANEKQIGMLGERVTRVEESAKQAHKRIDKLENGGE